MIARIKLYLAALGALVAALAMAYLKGRADKSADAGKDQLEMEIDAHERINDADTGGGATDGERIKRLREMASQLRD
jgi:hypothetical protein